jgi:hypothetical protein
LPTRQSHPEVSHTQQNGTQLRGVTMAYSLLIRFVGARIHVGASPQGASRMQSTMPHFLRFARALALVTGVATAGCSDTATGQDVPEGGFVDTGIDVSPDLPPPPGIVAAPDATPVTPDVGLIASPDVPAPGIMVAPDAGTDVFVGDGGPLAAPEMPWV